MPVISRTRRSANASASALATRVSGSNGSSRCEISSSAAPASDVGPGGVVAQRSRRSNASISDADAARESGRTRTRERLASRQSSASRGISSAKPSSSADDPVEIRSRDSARIDSAHRPAGIRSDSSRRIRAKQKPNGAPKTDVSNRPARTPRPPSSSTNRNHATAVGPAAAGERREETDNSEPRRSPSVAASIRDRPQLPVPAQGFPHRC